MKRINSSTVELTDQERKLAGAHEYLVDMGGGHLDAFHQAWQEQGPADWLPDADFVDWLIGPAPSELVDEVRYLIHCEMATCPDHGSVRLDGGGDAPGMAGGSDYWYSYSCGCTVTGSAMGASRRRADGTYGPVESEDSL